MHWSRLAIVLAALAALGWCGWQLRVHGPGGLAVLPGCYFRKWTGLDCPGCGMTRAASAALNGRVLEAFSFNPLAVILLPVAMIGLVPELFDWMLKRPVSWRLRPGRYATFAIVALVFAFWILRNLPWWPLASW